MVALLSNSRRHRNQARFTADQSLLSSLSQGAALAHVRHRALLTELGRWTRRDPLGYVDGFNLYYYVRAMPIRVSDWNGLSSGDGYGLPPGPGCWRLTPSGGFVPVPCIGSGNRESSENPNGIGEPGEPGAGGGASGGGGGSGNNPGIGHGGPGMTDEVACAHACDNHPQAGPRLLGTVACNRGRTIPCLCKNNINNHLGNPPPGNPWPDLMRACIMRHELTHVPHMTCANREDGDPAELSPAFVPPPELGPPMLGYQASECLAYRESKRRLEEPNLACTHDLYCSASRDIELDRINERIAYFCTPPSMVPLPKIGLRP